jgi:HEAT repeat protein
MTTCPTCGKPVDPLRARSVGVRDGKVVAYCSPECASAAESKPVAKVEPEPVLLETRKTPPTGVTAKATPAKGVDKIKTKTPAKGVDKVKTPAKGVELPKPKPPPEIEVDSGPVIEILHEPASGVVTSAPDRRVSGGIAATTPERGDESSPFKRTDQTPLPQPRGPFATGSFILESDDPDFEVDMDHRPRKRAPVFLVLLLLVVGGGAAYYKFVYLKPAKTDKVATPAPPPRPMIVDAPAPPVVTADDALDRARKVLRAALRNTPRVAQVAASALARTKDHEAIAWLAASLDKATDRAPRLELAYALGRGGDARGADALAQMLQTDPAARLDIAKRLAQLHDQRAIQPLLASLDVPQNRLSVAEYLVPFAEPHAIKALEEIRADDKQPDRQKRAVIALGLAGKAEVTADLRALLADKDYTAPAARALAELHDPAAKPVLVGQLSIQTLRLAGARALRRLEPKLDVAPLLPQLLAALDSANDIEQVHVAEAIVMLTDDAKLAEYE